MDQVEAEDPTFHQAALEDEAETAEKKIWSLGCFPLITSNTNTPKLYTSFLCDLDCVSKLYKVKDK